MLSYYATDQRQCRTLAANEMYVFVAIASLKTTNAPLQQLTAQQKLMTAKKCKKSYFECISVQTVSGGFQGPIANTDRHCLFVCEKLEFRRTNSKFAQPKNAYEKFRFFLLKSRFAHANRHCHRNMYKIRFEFKKLNAYNLNLIFSTIFKILYYSGICAILHVIRTADSQWLKVHFSHRSKEVPCTKVYLRVEQ